MQLVIVPWRDEWSREFDELAARLTEGLGPLALRIDHIGSTSVPGLPAKDVIDAQVIVRSLAPREEIVAAFARLGLGQRGADWLYQDHVPAGWEGDESAWGKLLFGPPEGERPSNVHVRAAGSPNERYALLFRDFLRADERARDLWGGFKERLAEETDHDLELYTELKDPATDVLIASAEEWARAAGWPGAPDSPV
jgi:GrpB-like predicted nucleotidyltransferase (UPF0157 family)